MVDTHHEALPHPPTITKFRRYRLVDTTGREIGYFTSRKTFDAYVEALRQNSWLDWRAGDIFRTRLPDAREYHLVR
jgi:hypothetical protein